MGEATLKPRHALNDRARDLRNHATDAERILWGHLRNSQIEGVKFRRQQPIEEYIVDFVAYSPKLVIELDGSQHADNLKYDEQRTACLCRNRFRVLRFWNNDIFENIEGVLTVIRQSCLELASPTPQPPPARGG
ncbi:partial putative protein, partial [Anaerolineae bacterium]